MSDALYIRHEGERVSVFTRSSAGELAQVGFFVSSAGNVDPLRALALVSDLDLTFGWTTTNGAAVNGAAVAHALPSATVVPPRRAGKPTVRHRPSPVGRRAVVLELLADGQAMSVGDMQATGRVSASDVRTGQLHGTLAYLVAQGLLERTGSSGSYRWQLAPPAS